MIQHSQTEMLLLGESLYFCALYFRQMLLKLLIWGAVGFLLYRRLNPPKKVQKVDLTDKVKGEFIEYEEVE